MNLIKILGILWLFFACIMSLTLVTMYSMSNSMQCLLTCITSIKQTQITYQCPRTKCNYHCCLSMIDHSVHQNLSVQEVPFLKFLLWIDCNTKMDHLQELVVPHYKLVSLHNNQRLLVISNIIINNFECGNITFFIINKIDRL